MFEVLYDLCEDFFELNNFIEDFCYIEKVEMMREKCYEWMFVICDFGIFLEFYLFEVVGRDWVKFGEENKIWIMCFLVIVDLVFVFFEMVVDLFVEVL